MARRKADQPVASALDDANNRHIIDLTLPEVSPFTQLPLNPSDKHQTSNGEGDTEGANASCLQMIIDIFPQISIQYALDLIGETRQTPSDCEHIIAQLLDKGTYPKEEDRYTGRKRKREPEYVDGSPASDASVSLGRDDLQEAKRRGEMSECCCCYNDFPIHRMTYCNGDRIHFFCLTCAKTYVEDEIGMGRCRPLCFADPDCHGSFLRWQLQEFLGEKSFDRLDHMQQQQDLAAAGLDFLSECPFCDFKAECPPIMVDREFRCENPNCRKISCRICENETHVPLTCDEQKQDSKLSVRHVVEEAMSAALIRHCNKCKRPFVKEHGCNKMTCPNCNNVQCYVCSESVRDYQHFDQGGRGNRTAPCPLHDNMEARHEREVKEAADEAMAKVQAQNPAITEQDLAVQVSGRVQQRG